MSLDDPGAGNGVTRRSMLRTLGAGALALGVGCTGRDDRRIVAPTTDGDAPPARGLLDGIDTIIVVMMENRSFDHYLGALRFDPSYPAAATIDGFDLAASNPDRAGRPVRVHRQPDRIVPSPRHEWDANHAAFNGGRNDGFVRANAGRHQRDVMGYHTREELGFFYALADRYTVCDRWFSSVMGPTWPNRYYLHAATSRGVRWNSPVASDEPPTVFDGLRERGLDGKTYSGGALPWCSGAFLGRSTTMRRACIEDFFTDARAGTLPSLAIVEPDFEINDDHPPRDVALAQAFVASIFHALAASPQWSRSLFVLTYDEHGGFYDHVPPPLTVDDEPEFRQLGFRVPSLVAGPTVRRGWVDHTQLEHVSVAATLQSRFGIASLNRRMDAACDLSSCIDPALVASPQPPPRDLPVVSLDEKAVAAALGGGSSQPELSALHAEGRIAAHHVDARGAYERTTSWLRHASELGAVALKRGAS